MNQILMVDDPQLIRTLQRSLLQRADCRVLCADSGDHLMARARDDRPDAVILSRTHLGDAVESMVDRLKEGDESSRIPLIVLGAPVDRADASIAEPVSPEDLGATLCRLLGLVCRTGRRRSIAIPVRWHRGAQTGASRTKDVGAGGLFLRSRDTLADDDVLQLIFELPEEGRPTIRAEGEVIRTVPYDRDSHLIPGVALRFRTISARDRRDIERFVGRSGEAGR